MQPGDVTWVPVSMMAASPLKSSLLAHAHLPPEGFALCERGLPGASSARVTGKQETGCHSLPFLQLGMCRLFVLTLSL